MNSPQLNSEHKALLAVGILLSISIVVAAFVLRSGW
jgi:hypothetical protein